MRATSGLPRAAATLLRELPQRAQLGGPRRIVGAGRVVRERFGRALQGAGWRRSARARARPLAERRAVGRRSRRRATAPAASLLAQRERVDDARRAASSACGPACRPSTAAARAIASSGEPRAISERGRGDVDADLATGRCRGRAPRTRRRSRSSTRRRSRTRAPAATRQVRHRRQRAPRREIGALRKRLGEKAIEVVVVRRRNRAARAQQLERADPLGRARGVERLPFGRVLVGPVEQHRRASQRSAAGNVRARSSALHCAISRASRSLRATDASAAFSASGGALR